MEELTPPALRSLQETRVMDRYRYKLVRPAFGSFGMALWSVYPMADATEWFATGHPELRAWLELPGGRRLRIDVVHTTAPVGRGEPTVWAEQLDHFRTELARRASPAGGGGGFQRHLV